MMEKTKKTFEENIENAQEGAIPDDEVDAVAGGDRNTTPHAYDRSVEQFHTGVHANTNRPR